jgi:hypothetical protein
LYDSIVVDRHGTFTEKENVDYRLPLADQENQTSVFRLPKTNGSLPFLFSVFSRQMELAIFR